MEWNSASSISSQGFLYRFVKKFYAPFLLSEVVRPLVVLIFMAWLALSLVVVPRLEVGLDEKLSVPEDSYVYKYFEYLHNYVAVGPPVYFVVKEGPDVSAEEFQNKLCSVQGCDDDSVVAQIKWAYQFQNSQVFYRALIYPRMLSNSASGFSVVEILVGMVFQIAAAFLIYYYVVEYMREPADFAEFAMNPARVAGVFLFTVGFVFNVRADIYLSRLKGGIQAYGIPRGGLFERVSAGNYFAEILKWWGFHLAVLSLPTFLYALAITFFLSIRGRQHHHWYLQQFGKGYPSQRKAVFTLTKFGGIVVLAFAKSQIVKVFLFKMYLLIVIVGALHGQVLLSVILSYFGSSLNILRVRRERKRMSMAVAREVQRVL
ncbi:unnamed protein product [Cyprideis torosa]|uniref:3-oxo-5-alpha-steroid 4-dehydrogenase C-terminal domain-containing protein n=1 Tax=Cyprideis torosa TaxID=163714 RepID=A0A7R8WIR4_9CRUS|nr:unnamed protein product [Cyprideis torosa]CAG0901070.1 unnamed protein product [Cyprideis torosa]